MNCVINHSVI